MGRHIGFVGTGLMGRGMARCLIRRGHTLRIYNRTRAKAEEVAKAGGQVAATPAEAARGADVVITMLADPAAVAACIEGPDGILSTLKKDAVVIDSSTVSPPSTKQMAERVRAKGGHLLDAPVFGSRNEAENGNLGFIVGGDRAVFDSVQDVLSALGKSTYMGPAGMGATAKLVVNLVIASELQAFHEGMVMATKAGLDPDVMYGVLMNSRAKAGIFEMKGPSILKRDFEAFFPLRLMDKDMRLALETAESLQTPLPVVRAVKEVLGACMSAGQSEEDFSSAIKHLERAAGVQVAAGRKS
ncbi:MAG TPA: NAD(P)-dependent oxidoreductase [Planctomycetota bacterium]|nr:NAD(P)-dependent oxidoreductase [Planctomycetota bacterium]